MHRAFSLRCGRTELELESAFRTHLIQLLQRRRSCRHKEPQIRNKIKSYKIDINECHPHNQNKLIVLRRIKWLTDVRKALLDSLDDVGQVLPQGALVRH